MWVIFSFSTSFSSSKKMDSLMTENRIWKISRTYRVIISEISHTEEKQREIEKILVDGVRYMWKVEAVPSGGFEEL
jgi:hypothetical protein